MENPARPYAVVLGGSKVSDKLGVIESLAPKADTLVIGGGMCFTFLKAQGYEVGTSLLEEDMVDTCKELLEKYGDVISLPVDIVVADKFDKVADSKTVAADEIPDGWMGLDVGPKSVEKFAGRLAAAKSIFWNGPAGVFEFEKSPTVPVALPRQLLPPPQMVLSLSLVVATLPQQFAPSYSMKMVSRTSPPVVALPSNCSRVKICPVSPFLKSNVFVLSKEKTHGS